MRVGVVILPDLRWPAALKRWREAESCGFSTAWTYDHLSWRSLRDGPWLGTVPLLAAVAASTTSLRFGTLVTSPNFRHPALLAKDAMTLDEVSAGRLDLGIGSGGGGHDVHVLGHEPLTPPQRASRFSEFVAAVDLMLREPAASFDGEYFTAVDSRTLPGCVQQPRVPFTIAAGGPRAMRVAARHGAAWVTVGAPTPAPTAREWFGSVSRQVGDLAVACELEGRDPGTLRRLAVVSLDAAWAQESVGAWDEFCGRVQAIGFTDVVVHWPRPEDPALPGPPLEVFDEIRRRLPAP